MILALSSGCIRLSHAGVFSGESGLLNWFKKGPSFRRATDTPALPQAEQAMLAGDWPRAASLYAEVVRLNPGDADKRVELARARLRAGDAAGAEEAARAAQKLDALSGRPEAVLGMAILALGRAAEGLDLLRGALSMNPADEEVRQALIDQGDLGRAIADGDAANRRRDWPQAGTHYADALRLDPQLAHIWVQYGHSLKERGLLGPAEAAYRRAVLINDGVLDHHLQLAHALKMQGKRAEATEAFLRVLQLDENHAEARMEVNAERGSTHARDLAGQRVVAERLAQAVPFSLQPLELQPRQALLRDAQSGLLQAWDGSAEAELTLPGESQPLELPAGRFRLMLEYRVLRGAASEPVLLLSADQQTRHLPFTEAAPGTWMLEIETSAARNRMLLRPTQTPASFFLLRLDLLRIGNEGGYMHPAQRQTAIKAARGVLSALPESYRAELLLSGAVRQVLAEFFPGLLVPSHSYFRDPWAVGPRASGVDGGAHLDAYARALSLSAGGRDAQYGAAATAPPEIPPHGAKAIAFYLPQFHPIPENDQWWGRGFTEWTNVAKSQPQFAGHDQPRLPGELGYYDLRAPGVMARQIELAKLHGVHGFCFHYYWFGGRRLLEKPIESFLADSSLDLPFCLCWANENWTRSWDGAQHDVLMAQRHSEDDHRAVFADLLRHFQDPRYIRADGRPVIVIYRIAIIPDAPMMIAIWRHLAAEAGLPGLYIVAARTFGLTPAEAGDVDAICDFPPHGVEIPTVENAYLRLNPAYHGRIWRYEEVAAAEMERLALPAPPGPARLPGVMPGWDNSARRPGRGDVHHGATPRLFHDWMLRAAETTLRDNPPEERLVFINAWNEWAEAAYLEPDRRYGYAMLAAVREAVRLAGQDTHALREAAAAHNRAGGRRADAVACMHIFYPEMVEEFAAALADARTRMAIDAIVTVPDTWGVAQLTPMLSAIGPVRVIVTANRGRDVWPFLPALRLAAELGYEIGVKLHTKKSPHRGDGDAWRRGLVGMLLAPPSMALIAERFVPDADLAIAAPEHALLPIRHEHTLHYNRENLEMLAGRLGLPPPESGMFVAGTMFWFRVGALAPIARALTEDDFGPELGQVDGTPAHAMERLFLAYAQSRGGRLLTLPDVPGLPAVAA